MTQFSYKNYVARFLVAQEGEIRLRCIGCGAEVVTILERSTDCIPIHCERCGLNGEGGLLLVVWPVSESTRSVM
jgi:hypothetical protein